MRKFIAFTFFSLLFYWIKACPVCEKNQPKLLRGITHGAGPESNWDFVIISVVMVIMLCCLFFTIRYLFMPGETNKNHIKYSLFNITDYER
jgi:hypothetical protein